MTHDLLLTSKGVLLVGRAWRKTKSWTGLTECALASAKLDEALRRPRNSTLNSWSCMRQPGKTCNRQERTIGDDTGPCRSTLLMARKARAPAITRQGSWPRRGKRYRTADSSRCVQVLSQPRSPRRKRWHILMSRRSWRYSGETMRNEKPTRRPKCGGGRERVLKRFHRMLSPSVPMKVIGVSAFFFQGLVDG